MTKMRFAILVICCMLAMLPETSAQVIWEQVDSLHISRAHWVRVHPNGSIFVRASPEVVRSTDNGATWTSLNTGFPYENMWCAGITSNGSVLIGLDGLMLRSTDNGDTWAIVDRDSGLVFNIPIWAISTMRNGDVVAGTVHGLYRSTDDGQHWGLFGLEGISSGDVVEDSSGQLFAGSDFGVYASTDSGSMWTGLDTTMLNAHALTMEKQGILYVGTNYLGIFRSTNGGVNWESAGLSETIRPFVHTTPGGGLFAGTWGKGIFHSTDEGSTWVDFKSGLPDSFVSSIEISAEGILYAGLPRAGLFRTTRSVSTVNIEIMDRWNLVSVPIMAADLAMSFLFPSATSPAVTFEGSYAVKETLARGVGYWVKFNGNQTVPINGLPVYEDTIAVQEGWNLIGSICSLVSTSSITSIPPGLMTSPFFGYSGRYSSSPSIIPGKAYWVKVSQNGMIILK